MEIEFFFPQNLDEIIVSLTKKYGLLENLAELDEKLEKGEKLSTELISETAVETIKKDLPFEVLASLLKERLKLPLTEAERLAKEIQDEIIENTVKVKKEVAERIEKPRTQKKSEEEKEEETGDVYREPIE